MTIPEYRIKEGATFLELSNDKFQQMVLGALLLLLDQAHRMEKRYGETDYAQAFRVAAQSMHHIIDPENADY